MTDAADLLTDYLASSADPREPVVRQALRVCLVIDACYILRDNNRVSMSRERLHQG